MAQQKPITRATLNITLSPSHHVYLRLCAMRDLASVAETVRRIIDREMERELRRPARPEDLDRFREETERLRASYQDARDERAIEEFDGAS